MEPNQFKQFCSEIYNVSLMHNNLIDKNEMSDYLDMKKIFEKSIVSKTKIERNTKITFEMLAFKKPGNGIPAADYKKLIGRKAKHTISSNTLIRMDDID